MLLALPAQTFAQKAEGIEPGVTNLLPGSQSAGESAQSDARPSPGMMPAPRSPVVGAGVSSSPSLPGLTPSASTADYPTVVSADYVFGCMATNGQTRTALEQCSCSFDVVASLISYRDYVDASTFLSMGQVTGEKGVLFKSSAQAKESVGNLRRAQAEAEIRCFE